MTHWLALLAAQTIAANATEPNDRAIEMEVSKEGDQIKVELHGNSPKTQHVSFAIEVTGSSNSKHSGSLTLAANSPQTLSTIKVSTSGKWCARVMVEEEGRAPYELSEGSCAD
ncbi:curli-like amyloid fiber formation chaperone CsgH [uncultured Erythrobacter sp.]|uniref:curli-like amyloid fiber formation chaperone CsgH n=1 Tax=uncultured Erythrobacter sp. TaxID=263913 RepID=UPI0026240C73|nr:curli-like amyloid fiber formation chaperone CsgH [uncultured Erythrobacter sp.]